MSAVDRDAAGLTVCDRSRRDPSYRLYNSREEEVARLLDADGHEVHRWSYPQGRSWHYAEMLPDGSLLAIVDYRHLRELDWSGDLRWKSEQPAHHDFDRLPNGHTLFLSHERRPDPWGEAGREIAFDVFYERTPDGAIVWRWAFDEHAEELEALAGVPLCVPQRWGDWPHLNTCEVLPDTPAGRRDPRFRAGNLLTSARHASTIFVIDRQTGRIVWAWGPGEVLGQHMPTLLDDGHILLFDNGWETDEATRGRSRVLELGPRTGRIVWQYVADPPESFYSPTRGGSQRLPNGNTLIAASNTGRLFEVTRGGEIVWEYWNPNRKAGTRPPIYRVVAYPPALVEPLLAGA